MTFLRGRFQKFGNLLRRIVQMPWQVTNLFQHGFQHGSRSTILTTLGWMGGILATGLVAAATQGAASWVQIYLAVLLGIDFITFIGAYIYWGAKAPDSLRSEKFYIEKLAIEKGIIGDSVTGVLAPPDQPSGPIIGESSTPRIGSRP